MATYGKWITVEDGCELPNEWEGVIVAARTRTIIAKHKELDGLIKRKGKVSNL